MRVRRWVATGFGGLDDFALVDDEVPPPGPGEVTVEVRAAGVNPADLKHARRDPDPTRLPLPVGYELSGVVTGIGPSTGPSTGFSSGAGFRVGDEVLAFRVRGGYATALNVPVDAVFAKPPEVGFEQAAGLLLTGTTAADMLRAAEVGAGETVVLHGASGAVGTAVLQLARARGVRVIGTAGPERFEHVRGFGGIPVSYGPGLTARIRAAVGSQHVAAALDAAGTDEAVDASLALVADRSRIVTVAAPSRAAADGFTALGGAQPVSLAFRDGVRADLIRLAGRGELVVPIAARYPLDHAREALALVAAGHAGGKVVLEP